jgi:hypothetical protein
MNRLFFRRVTYVLLVALMTFVLTGCPSKIDGKYQNANGTFSIELKSGKASITAPLLGTLETPYEVNGDKITLKYQGEDLVLTRNSDGSLEGGLFGKLTKK